MSEGILLSPVTRGVLLPLGERLARLDESMPQILAATTGETDAVALQATLACLLWQTMSQASWCGFYRRVAARELAVGPYQGNMGCLRIAFDRGVCGLSAREQRVVRVPDVHAFPDHIACDGGTRSELVVPLVVAGALHGVLDLDSYEPDAFADEEAARLVTLLDRVFADARF